MPTPKTLALCSALALCLVAGSAVAGPDWSAIERARTAKKTEAVKSKDETGDSKQAHHAQGPRSPFPPQYGNPATEKSATVRVVADSTTD